MVVTDNPECESPVYYRLCVRHMIYNQGCSALSENNKMLSHVERFLDLAG